MNKKKIITALALVSLLTPLASAHSGHTDAAGGHWDSSTGEYHYHHGYPAHQHENGICPYEQDTSYVKEGTQSAVAIAEARQTAESEPEEEEETEELYNGGYGDDGTYETAYNLGYQHGMETLCELNKDTLPDASGLTSQLCHENALTGATPYEAVKSSYNEAYKQGYYQSETDFYAAVNALLPEDKPDSDSSSQPQSEEEVEVQPQKSEPPKDTVLETIKEILIVLLLTSWFVYHISRFFRKQDDKWNKMR